MRSIFAKITKVTERFVNSKHMLSSVGVASLLESIIVPIPLETILIPLMQARREKLFLIATIALLGCMVGASVGYAAGYFLMDSIGSSVIDLVSNQQQYEHVKQKMEAQGFWFVFSVGVVPIPFQIAMLAAGATQYSFILFLTASILSRAIRYYGLALLVYFAGNKAQKIYEKHKTSTTLIICGIIGFAWAFAIWG